MLGTLNSVKLALEHLRQSDAGAISKEQDSVFHTIITAVGNMETMLNDLSDLTLYEADCVDIERVPRNFDEFVPAVCTQYTSRLSSKKIALSVDISPGLSTLEVDSDKIERVLKHLIENALHLTPHGGSITIRVCRPLRVLMARVRNILRFPLQTQACRFPGENFFWHLINTKTYSHIDRPMLR